jgi:uncharacterized protein YaiE (UPF0345 family)
VTGSIFGPYDSPLPKGSCEIPDWTAAGEAIAAKDGYSRTAFDDIVIATPSDGVCPYAGIGNFGSRGVRLDGTFNVGVIAHELGHNFSLAHAGTLACGTASIGGSCTADQYGDPFDDMGRTSPPRHYSAVHKRMLGWLPDDETTTVASGAQTVAVSASEQRSVGSTQLVVVSMPNGTRYAIERRASYGAFDQSMAGVWVRIWGAPGTATLGPDDTQLLDMTPGSAGGFTDANLAAGRSFVDAANNITIRNLWEGNASSVLQVCVGACPAAPSIAPFTIGVMAGQAYVFGTGGPDRIRVSAFGTTAVEINTGGWPITTATGCVQFMARAFCTAAYANVNAGGGDDRIELVGSVCGFINAHYGNDVMIGGTGADVFEGGPGIDKVDYSKRIGEHITGTPGTGADDGRPGEGDNVMADVEQVLFPPN